MTKEFEYSGYDRNELIYKFSVMTQEQIKEKTEMYAKYQAEKKKADAAKKAAAAAKKAAAEKEAEDKGEEKKES